MTAVSLDAGWRDRFAAARRYLLYAQIALRHATLRKGLNWLRVERDYRRRALQCSGRPYALVLDTNNICNLRCPLCPTGIGTIDRTKGRMPPATFQHIIDHVGADLFMLALHNWGEPLLNRQIFDLITYAHEANVGTVISTNGTVLREGDAERLVTCGLDHLIFSVDGVSQGVYETYRVGGDVEKAFANMRAVVEAKRRLRGRLPLIEWQYLVRHGNEHEVPLARRKAKALGVDILKFAPLGIMLGNTTRPFDHALVDEWLTPTAPDTVAAHKADYLIPQPCFWLWKSAVINYDTTIAPCCWLSQTNGDFGTLAEDTFDDIWNGPAYQAARSRCGGRDLPDRQGTICDGCRIYPPAAELQR